MNKEILTRCGYRCDLCLAYKENVKKNDRRKHLSEGWYKYFGLTIQPEDIVCDGCLNDDCMKTELLDEDCPIRPCVKKKGYENCSECDDFMCETYKERLVDIDELEKEHGKIPEDDYELFIRPYENCRRILKLRAQNK
ncbi:DUF3795 domain-containing protein [Vallitalea okinawensis]|uniref:DUF3795 domain-containing protein n=1 Tax=Vallitalea okinawensis TaxID=2078660 RepID=UPI0013002838|nr:DUF3795 domain-containing protein [Vallitalea okinawensis]